MEELKPNVGKNDIIVMDGVSYQRLPIRTHLITDKDNILDVAEKYGSPVLTEPDDILFISEKCVACTQKRAIPLEDIKPRKLATWLSKHVTKTSHGIGLGMPETMECALREVGTLRILFAAAISVIGKKIFRKKGWFYAVAGYRARSIDGSALQPLCRTWAAEARSGRRTDQGARRSRGLHRGHQRFGRPDSRHFLQEAG